MATATDGATADSAELLSGACDALEVALHRREPASREHGIRVAHLAVEVGRRLELSADEVDAFARTARLVDVGKIGLPDSVLHKRGALQSDEWDLLAEHPVIGAAMLDELADAAGLAPLVRSHHERWDGQGYPDGLAGERIPLASRVIAACDAFVAMTSARTYRSAIDRETAVQQLRTGAGVQFDPRVAETLADLILQPRTSPAPQAEESPADDDAGRNGAGAHTAAGRPTGSPEVPGMRDLIERVQPIPALQSALDAFADALATTAPNRSQILAIIEHDPGLAVAVLRAAADKRLEPGPASAGEAFDRLGLDELRALTGNVLARDFIWARGAQEEVLEGLRLHAVATQRAALRIAAVIDYPDREELALSALLHDLGKYALAQILPKYPDSIRAHARSPEQAIALERRLLQLDHAMVGSLLARRWFFAERLADAIGGHHVAEGEGEAAIIRLADTLAHHVQGTAAPADRILHLGRGLHLGPGELREIMMELPHAGGSQRRRVTPSPLSKRELDVLRRLAQGKLYKEIAAELGLKPSTIRTHLHKTYAKLGSADRAQAVLTATDRGWL